LDLTEAFSQTDVQLSLEGAGEEGDIYHVARVDGARMKLVAFRGGLRYAVPEVGQTVVARTIAPEGRYQVAAKVEDRELGPYVALVLTQVGEPQTAERRGDARIRAHVPGRVEGLTSDPLDIVTENLSLSGLGALAAAPLRTGRAVRLNLAPGAAGHEVSCLARVTRCRPKPGGEYSIGMLIVEMEEEDRRRLEEFLRQAAAAPETDGPRLPEAAAIPVSAPSEPLSPSAQKDLERVFAARMTQVLKAPNYDVAYTFRTISTDGRRLKMVAPTASVEGMDPRIGDDVWIRCAAEGAVYEAPGQISSGLRGAYVVLEVRLIDRVSRVQRREFVRVNVELEAELVGVYEDATRARTHNLSGGGAMVKSPRPLPQEELVYAKILLAPGDPSVRGHARVVWCAPADDGTQYFVGLQFLEIKSSDRERIVRFCMERLRREVKSLRKRLGEEDDE